MKQSINTHDYVFCHRSGELWIVKVDPFLPETWPFPKEEMTGMSQSNFYRHFKLKTGMSFVSYINIAVSIRLPNSSSASRNILESRRESSGKDTTVCSNNSTLT